MKDRALNIYYTKSNISNSNYLKFQFIYFFIYQRPSTDSYQCIKRDLKNILKRRYLVLYNFVNLYQKQPSEFLPTQIKKS